MIVIGTTDVESVREAFVQEYLRLVIEEDTPVGSKTIDLQGVSFIADQDSIFGTVNREYIERELEWYLGRSLNVHDIPGDTPKIWEQIATEEGWINSNYGYLFLDKDNGTVDPYDDSQEVSQFEAVVHELIHNPDSRRATAVYTRPTIHSDAVYRGMQDFICTNAVNYRLDRANDAVDCFVQMRSNDAVFGYRNDVAWQRHALAMVAQALGVQPRHVVWQAASLHVYPRHHHLIETYRDTGEWNVPVTKQKESTDG